MTRDASRATIHPQVILLASRYDLACDYIVSLLREKPINYLRLNSEDLKSAKVYLNPLQKSLEIKLANKNYMVNSTHLRSVFFRRPVSLRDYGDDRRSPAERFSRLQWSAFMRSLMIFNEALWINDPVAIYRAEHKAIQLSIAKQLGFHVPETVVTNAPQPGSMGIEFGKQVATKGIDTILLRDHGQEAFGFTTIENTAELEPSDWYLAPTILQTALTRKLDIRVTVVGSDAYAADVTVNNQPIEGDWRTYKGKAKFTKHRLPKDVAQLCCQLVKTLGLYFGGIDLALQDSKYYFLEINPTGEWAWLVDAAGIPIDRALANALIQGAKDYVV